MWADTAAVNQNYFWAMFFIGWVLYLLNGLIWAGFERSRASLILLTARKESTGSNARASRFDPSPSFIHDVDGQSIHSEQSSIGNVLRSTVSRDWSRGQYPHQQEVRACENQKQGLTGRARSNPFHSSLRTSPRLSRPHPPHPGRPDAQRRSKRSARRPRRRPCPRLICPICPIRPPPDLPAS